VLVVDGVEGQQQVEVELAQIELGLAPENRIA
jgi:hypothetical protein